MRNIRIQNGLAAGLGLAVLVAVGCTTHVPPDGQQVSSAELMTSVDPAGLTPGNPPLIISGPAGMTSAAVESAATMAARQTSQGVFVGVASPSQAPGEGVTVAESRPAPLANPQASANRTISSPGAAAIEDANLGLVTPNTEAASASGNISMSTARSATLPGGALSSTAQVVYGTSGVDDTAVVPVSRMGPQVIYGSPSDAGAASVTVLAPVVTARTPFGTSGPARAYRNGLRVTTTSRGTKLLTNVP